MKTKKLWLQSIFVLILALSLGSIASIAQENKAQTKSGRSMTVTGCLQRGDQAGEYSVTGEDGKRYGLHPSKSVDLSKHVGHKVSVTGSKISEQNEEKEKKEAGGGEYADLRVTDIKHISETCQ
jgi:hypothetical protein